MRRVRAAEKIIIQSCCLLAQVVRRIHGSHPSRLARKSVPYRFFWVAERVTYSNMRPFPRLESGPSQRCTPTLRNPAPLAYQPKPSMAWAFAARSQLTPASLGHRSWAPAQAFNCAAMNPAQSLDNCLMEFLGQYGTEERTDQPCFTHH